MQTEDKKLWKDTVVFMLEDIKYYKALLDKNSVLQKKQELEKSTTEKCEYFLIDSDLILNNLLRHTDFKTRDSASNNLQCEVYFEKYESVFYQELKMHFKNYEQLKKSLNEAVSNE